MADRAPGAVGNDGAGSIDAEIGETLSRSERQSQRIQVVLETYETHPPGGRTFLVAFNGSQRIRRRAQANVPNDEWFIRGRGLLQPVLEPRLLHVELSRFLRRIRPRVHDLAGRSLADAGETFPGAMDLVIAEAWRRVTFHFKISLVFPHGCSSTIPPQATQTKRIK